MLTLWLRALFSLDSSPHCVNSSHRIQNSTISFLRKRNKKAFGSIEKVRTKASQGPMKARTIPQLSACYIAIAVERAKDLLLLVTTFQDVQKQCIQAPGRSYVDVYREN